MTVTEQEVDGNGYKYVYGNDRLSVNVTGVENGAGHILENGEIRFYYHMDLRGTADYLTSPVSGKIESWTHYNEWGKITHNTVVKCSQREFDLVMLYATHDFDQVLGMYYAKARFYDAKDRRFIAEDAARDGYNWYIYCSDNPLIFVDPTGLAYDMYLVKKGEDTNITLASGVLEDTRLASKGFFAVREVAGIVDKASSYSASVDWDPDTNYVSLSLINNGLKRTFSVSIEALDKGWGEGRQIAATSGGSQIYFSFYNCVFADDTTYVNIEDVAKFLGVYIVAQSQTKPIEPKNTDTRAVGVSAVAELKWRLALSAGLIWDSAGDIGLMGSVSGGVGTVSLGFGAFYAVYYTPTLASVTGVSYELGGSIDFGVPVVLFGVPFTLGAGYDTSFNADGSKGGYVVSVNANLAGLPGDIPNWEAHGQMTVTGTVNVSGGIEWLLKILLGANNEKEVNEHIYGQV